MKVYEAIKLEFEGEADATRKILERVPDGKFDWKPHDKSMSLGTLASHVAEIPSWMVPTINQDVLEFTKDQKAWAASERAELVARFDTNMKDALACLDQADESKLMGAWSLKLEGHELVNMPRLLVVRKFVTAHLVHHRAQLGVYLRLLDIPLPGTYGPSADEQH